MKTLVIHPFDTSTIFLEQVYKDKSWTIISDIYTTKKKLRNEIKSHDRIIMMGHGSKHGLYAGSRGLMIDSTYVHYLRDKQIVAIWCNADEFINKYGLNGFYTGMIISELSEANYLNIDATIKDIKESNILFTKAITESIDSNDMLLEAKNIYNIEDTNNSIIKYNKVRLYNK